MFKNPARRLARFLLLLQIAIATGASYGASFHLAWDSSPEADVKGYRISYGTTPGGYTNHVDVGNVTDYVLTGLSHCSRYYFAAKAYDLAGNVSQGYSNEVRGLVNPSIASVSPSAAERGQALTVTVTGSSFDVGASVVFSDRINVYSTSYVSCTQLRATISLSGEATLGPQSAWVVNPDGSYGALGLAFQVLPVTVPMVTAVSPAPGSRSVAVTVRPSVTFSERVNPLTIRPDTVMLLRPDGTAVNQAAGYPLLDTSGRIVTVVPSTDLQYGTLYRIQVLGGVLGVRDSQGTPMASTIIYGLGFLTGDRQSSDVPAVVGTTPSPGASNVSTDAEPTVSFSKAIDPLTVSEHTVQLLGPDGSPVPQIGAPMLDASGYTARIRPVSPLQQGVSYSLHVGAGSNGVRDIDGLPMASLYAQTPGFTTAAGPDGEAPRVSSTSPDDGTLDMSVDDLIGVVFSEAMNPSSITPASVQLLDPLDRPVLQAEGSPAVEDGGRIVTIVPDRRLRYSTAYRVLVLGGANGVRDNHDNAMADDYQQVRGLSTSPAPAGMAPAVISTNPVDGDLRVPRDVHPTVTFSAPMDPTSITADAVRLLDADGQPVPQGAGSPLLEASGTIVTLAPAQPLEPGAVYFLEVPRGYDGVLDDVGTPMNGGFYQGMGFTILPEDAEGPVVIWTDPDDGQSRVERDLRPRIYFDEALDPASVTPLTIMLLGPDGTVVEQADTSPFLDAPRKFIRIIPRQILASSAEYRIQVLGGPEGLRDVFGNPMLATYTLEFETR